MHWPHRVRHSELVDQLGDHTRLTKASSDLVRIVSDFFLHFLRNLSFADLHLAQPSALQRLPPVFSGSIQWTGTHDPCAIRHNRRPRVPRRTPRFPRGIACAGSPVALRVGLATPGHTAASGYHSPPPPPI